MSERLSHFEDIPPPNVEEEIIPLHEQPSVKEVFDDSELGFDPLPEEVDISTEEARKKFFDEHGFDPLDILEEK